MGAPPPPPHMSDYPSALGVWQSPDQRSSLPWMCGSDPNAASGMGTGAGMRVGSDIQNGMHCQDSTVTAGPAHVQYEGQSIDEGQIKKSTIEYRTNDSGHYLNPKKEPDGDIADGIDKVLPVKFSNSSSELPPVSISDSSLVDSATDGSMNPPAITPTKLQFPFSPTPLPPHLQSHSNYNTPQSTLLRTESMPQIPQTFAAPSSVDGYPSLQGNRVDVYPFAPPPIPPRPQLRQVMSAVDLTALNPTRDVYEGPILPKRAPVSNFVPPPPKRPNTLQRCHSQPNIATTQQHHMLDHLMSILSEEPELPDPEPGDPDMFDSSSNVMSPQVPWGCYPEPGQLSQMNAISMPVLNDPDRYQHYNYLASSQHMHHAMRTSEPYLNQLPLQSTGYIPRVPPIDRPPAHVAKPPEILEAQGQESDQSSECSIFQYENRLNSTGTVEQRQSDGSDNICRGSLYGFHAGSLPNLSEMSSHCPVFPRLDTEDPCDNVFGSPLSGRNLNAVPYFEFGTRDGVKSSSSGTQVSDHMISSMVLVVMCVVRRPRGAEGAQDCHQERKNKEKNFVSEV